MKSARCEVRPSNREKSRSRMYFFSMVLSLALSLAMMHRAHRKTVNNAYMQMWISLRTCREWQSRLNRYKRYCFKNGMTSDLSLDNGGGTHFCDCTLVTLLMKSDILVSESESFLLCSLTLPTVYLCMFSNSVQCNLWKSTRAMHLVSTSSYLSVKVWKYFCWVISPLALASASFSANFRCRASNTNLTSFAAALPTASFNDDVS